MNAMAIWQQQFSVFGGSLDSDVLRWSEMLYSEVTVLDQSQVEALEPVHKLRLGGVPRNKDMWLLDLKAF
jgi:hypothetical protein